MIIDIYSGFGDSDPQRLTVANGKLYFTANQYYGRELWMSDGTESGTVMVKEIYPGGNSNPDYLTQCNSKLFFNANDGIHGAELWVSDGTESGTMLVKDINPGSTPSNPSYLTEYGGKLYENFVQPMIPREWFEEEKRKIAARAEKLAGRKVKPQYEPRRVGTDYLLSGLVVCGATVNGISFESCGNARTLPSGIWRNRVTRTAAE